MKTRFARLLHPNRLGGGAVCLAAIASIAASQAAAAQSYWNLAVAPPELAALGYAHGVLILDDERAANYLAEFVPYAGYKPPDLAIVSLVKADPTDAFAAVEAVSIADASGAPVPGRRVAAAEVERFNGGIVPALARVRPDAARFVALAQFFYAKDLRFQSTRFYRERQETTKTGYEEPLLELHWRREPAGGLFMPAAKLLEGVPADGLPATIAEAAAGRTPAEAAPNADPFRAAQTAIACVRPAPRPGSDPDPPAWQAALRRLQVWSLLYGYSLAPLYAGAPSQRPATCAADMRDLAARLPGYETQAFAPGWRGANLGERIAANAAALLALDGHFAAAWCASTFREAQRTLDRHPALLDLDASAPGGPQAIAQARGRLEDDFAFWDSWPRRHASRSEADTTLGTFRTMRGVVAYNDYVLYVAERPIVEQVVRAAYGADPPELRFDAPAVVARLQLGNEIEMCRAARPSIEGR